jgi:hypothetical protein
MLAPRPSSLALQVADLYNGSMSATLMQNRFWLHKVADSSTGDERFIIVSNPEAGKDADGSRPMSAGDAKTALHKLGTSDAVIEIMFDRARNVSPDEETKS